MAITVLAIDDTKSVVDVIRLFLEGSGFAVKGVTNPTEGIALAQAGGIDLILLDIIMPRRFSRTRRRTSCTGSTGMWRNRSRGMS
jgi:CheY-like chemotaxis protein